MSNPKTGLSEILISPVGEFDNIVFNISTSVSLLVNTSRTEPSDNLQVTKRFVISIKQSVLSNKYTTVFLILPVVFNLFRNVGFSPVSISTILLAYWLVSLVFVYFAML